MQVSNLKYGAVKGETSGIVSARKPEVPRNLPVNVDAQFGVLPDLEADILLGVEKIVHHLVVNLEIADSYHALRRIRRQRLLTLSLRLLIMLRVTSR